MKKIVFALVCLFGILCLSSCVKMRFDPEENRSDAIYTLPANAKVMKVEDFKGAFPLDLEQIPFPYIDEFTGDTCEVYLYVQIIGNDMSGNIYKNIYVRDASVENGHALNISVDKTGLYNFYPIGQKIYIRCTGLYLGRYNGLPQLGYIYNGGIGRMADALFDSHVYKSGGVPVEKDLPKPIEINKASDLTPDLLNQLVVLKNVHFKLEDVGKPFAPAPPVGSNPTSTDRTMILADGTELMLRTSSACRFFSYTVPDSVGEVLCMYTVYGSTAQMYLRAYSDIFPKHGFKWNADTISVKKDTLLRAPFSRDLNPFSPVNVLGTAVWTLGTKSGVYAQMTGYLGETGYEANEDWLVSPVIDLTKANYTDLLFSFEQALNYKFAQSWSNFQVRVSTDYDPMVHSNPNSAHWEALEIANLPSGDSFNFVTSKVDLKTYMGRKIYIAWVYKCTGNSNETATWEIKNALLVGQTK